MRRTVIEASKQCGRTRLAEVSPTQELAEYLSSAPQEMALRLVAHPDAPHVPTQISQRSAASHPPTSPVMLAVGPEGGFTKPEIQLAIDAGWQIFSLGPRILRTETAAIALMAARTIQLPSFID